MNGALVLKLAAAVYFAEGLLLLAAILAWPFVPERPFDLHKAVFGGIVALACALMGMGSLKSSRDRGASARTLVAGGAMLGVFFGALAGAKMIAFFAIPFAIVVWGVYWLGRGTSARGCA